MGIMNKIKLVWAKVRYSIKTHMKNAKSAAAEAYDSKPKGIRFRFNKFMALHRTKINMLAGFASFVVAGFFINIIVGFIVLGIALLLIEWLSGG
jgi:hypothetical protein